MLTKIENIIAHNTVRRMGLFIASLAIFETLYLMTNDSEAIIMFAKMTAHLTALVLSGLGEAVRVDGISLYSPVLNMRIVSECTALTPTMVFISAVIAFPSSRLAKLKGILLGIVGLNIINLIRVVSLYYIGTHMPNQMEFAHIVMWQTLMILIAIGLWSLWASGKINLIIRPFLSSQIVLVLIWATIGFALWYLFANTYTLFIGRLAWEYFPNNVILSVTDHHFIIVLKNAINNSQSPPMQLLIHNFGFGLVITSAIILGTNKDSWKLRFISLCCVWLFLFFIQTGLLITAAHTYKSAMTEAKITLGFTIFIKSLHFIVTVLPIMLSALWLIAPFQRRQS